MNQLTGEHFAAINDINQRRHAFIDYISRFYNANNRATSGSTCIYSKTDNSPGCAIGQFLPADLSAELDQSRGTHIETISIHKQSLYLKIPAWMREMGVKFLLDCQRVHDDGVNWSEAGIDSCGVYRAREIKENIYNNLYNSI
jgi:hypothetical protein